MSTLSTPCLKICVMDPSARLCQGCGRTMAEITGWLRMSEAERLAIMATLPERLGRMTPARAPQTASC